MAIIKGITVILQAKTPTGVDAFNRPTYATQDIPVENVLVAPLSEAEILDTLNLTGRRAIYQLGIPKGDTHTWVGNDVVFFGKAFRVISEPVEGIEAMIPLAWNKKVKVEIIG